MGYYDVDPPDPGSAGNGETPHMVLRCTECAFRVSDPSSVKAVAAAQQHYRETGHDISYRGVIQTWPRRRDGV